MVLTKEEQTMNKCNDSWISKDKALHFGVCFVLAAICPLVAIVLAIIKEVHDDGTEGNHWCWKDAFARFKDDADIVAALQAKNTALEGTGGSISLVSA